MRQDQFIKGQVALEAWRQAAHFGGHRCMLMVACGIANRVRAGWGGWLEVIDRIPLFAGHEQVWKNSGMPQLHDPNFLRLLQEVDAIYDGPSADIVSEGLWWADTSCIDREWFTTEIVEQKDKHLRVSNSGTLQFWT